MKTINEIFVNNPSLLEQPEVIELINQFKIQFDAIKQSKSFFWDQVTSLTMNSECFVINGIPCKEVIEKINSLAFGDDMM